VNGFYPTKDGRQVMMCAGPPYMKLLNTYLNFLDCGNNRKSITATTMRYTADELEEALAELAVPGCRAFDRGEWLVLTQMERIAKINGLDRLDKTVVEAARQSLVVGQL
jgi:hypothetical protein